MTARKLTQEEGELVANLAMQVDVSQYVPRQTYIDNHGKPTVEQMADYIAEIRILEVKALLTKIQELTLTVMVKE